MQTLTAKRSTAVASSNAWSAMRSHWPEYLMEAAELGLFMMSACAFTVLLEHPLSQVPQTIESNVLRRILTGLAMGTTAIAIVYSPLGQRSGAHFNPSVTLTYFLLGKVEFWDAAFYVLAQFAGAITGVAVSSILIGLPLRHSAVNYAVTVPGPRGALVAFGAEVLISFILMSTILAVSNTKRLARFTPLFTGALVSLFISIEGPFSGMSMNPARTLGSALPAAEWTALWVYFLAPPAGMILASLIHQLRPGIQRVYCAKLYHSNNKRCVFRCNHAEM